jgi:CheY-like chemotaxis protein
MRQSWCGFPAGFRAKPDKAFSGRSRSRAVIAASTHRYIHDMAQRIFVKVLGFTDVERHALNTVFRLSEQSDPAYALWMPDAPEAPLLALVDGESYEARLGMESPGMEGLRLIWVGTAAPPDAWRTYQRPIAWPDVISSMDELFAAAEVLDFDLDSDTGGPETLPPAPEAPRKRALIASGDRDERLYLRAKLALAHLTQADEAETAAQALELTRANQYEVALVDFGLPGVGGWDLLKELSNTKPAIPHVIITKDRASLVERARAWFGGAEAFFDKPPHPGKLHDLLRKI